MKSRINNPLLGHSAKIHARLDDGRQPSGHAGADIAGGVIGWAMPAK